MRFLDVWCKSEFGNYNLTWNTTNADLAGCLQSPVLLWVPCAFLLLFLPIEINQVVQSQSRSIPASHLNCVKLVLINVLIACTIVRTLLSMFLHQENRDLDDFVSPVVRCASYILVLVLTLLGRRYGIRTSGVQFIFWLLATGAELISFSSLILYHFWHTEKLDRRIFLLEICQQAVEFMLVSSMFVLSFLADKKPKYHKQRQNNSTENESPELDASFISRLSYHWMNSFFIHFWQNDLKPSDVFDLSADDKSYTTTKHLKRNLKHTRNENAERSCHKRSSESEDINILPPLLRTFFPPILFHAIFQIIADITELLSALLMMYLIESSSNDEHLWQGVLLSFYMLLATVSGGFFTEAYKLQTIKTATRLKSAIMNTLYEKIMRLSSASRQTLGIGFILNSTSIDSQRLANVTAQFHMIWSTPIQLIIVSYWLWKLMGVAALTGTSLMIVFLFVNTAISKIKTNLEVKRMELKDKRIKKMNEILNGIKVVKLCGWEDAFEKMVVQLREDEERINLRVNFFNGLSVLMRFSSSTMIQSISLITYALLNTEHGLSASTAFVSMRLFHIQRVTILNFPEMINLLSLAYVSLTRINQILNGKELGIYVKESVNKLSSNPSIKIAAGSFGWSSDCVSLSDVNFEISQGSLVAVIGEIGSGKTSLISAIAGEMAITEGTVAVSGSIAYVPQQPWILNRSLKDNIVFDHRFEQEKYRKVLDACCLTEDLFSLPHMDDTEIGEKGINLSGGQKQRVSLARAVYGDADVYLMDDTLAAVDAQVGKHIFEHVIGNDGILKGKTRVMVTHNVSLLPKVDLIYIVKNGKILGKGSYLDFISDSENHLESYLKKHQLTHNYESSSVLEEQQETTKYRKMTRKIRNNSSNQPNNLVEPEKVAVGSIPWSKCREYISAFGFASFAFVVVSLLVERMLMIASFYWLATWTSANDRYRYELDVDENRNSQWKNQNYMIIVYGCMTTFQSVLLVFGLSLLATMSQRASSTLHCEMLKSLMKSPISFFDTTPVGRILNRFSKDLDDLESTFTTSFSVAIMVFSNVIVLSVGLVIKAPTIAISLGVIFAVYTLLQKLYTVTGRQLKRIDASARSPLLSHFSESLAGISVIRAQRLMQQFYEKNQRLIDKSIAVEYLKNMTIRWMGFRLNMMSSIIYFSSGLSCTLQNNEMAQGDIGYILFISARIVSGISFMSNSIPVMESLLISIERITEYCSLETEAEREKSDVHLPASWPYKGEIVFESYSTRYRRGLDLVLKDVSFVINPTEKVGVVGRTGAGKSSLTVALFRLVEAASGKIIVDGIDIAELGLNRLRSRLAIIPQDPILFAGTLRQNLDPSNIYSDENVLDALEHSHLRKTFKETLDFQIEEGGENLSVGQRQLVCLARALLRKPKILVLDEATASVDLDTDDLIQNTIRSKFASCTIITIAHRLNSILDYDRQQYHSYRLVGCFEIRHLP